MTHSSLQTTTSSREYLLGSLYDESDGDSCAIIRTLPRLFSHVISQIRQLYSRHAPGR